MARGGYTYIMTNKARGVLYIGVTANLAVRVLQAPARPSARNMASHVSYWWSLMMT